MKLKRLISLRFPMTLRVLVAWITVFGVLTIVKTLDEAWNVYWKVDNYTSTGTVIPTPPLEEVLEDTPVNEVD